MPHPIRHTAARRLALALTLVACASGGSTRIESSYTEPSAAPLQFRRVLAVYVAHDPAVRRSVEDNLASRIPNTFAAYRTLPNLSVTDRERAREQLRGKLFDGVVVMRVVRVDDQQSYVPGASWYASYPSFYGYWGSSWTMVHAPGYAVNDRLVAVETAVYSIEDDRLLWAGRTQTENPGSVDKLVDRTVDAVTKELRTQRLIQ